MDINDLKKMSVEKKKEKENIESARAKTLERFEDFKGTCNELSKLITEKVATKKMELGGEFREFFESNGFAVVYSDKGEHRATFEETVVVLKDEQPDEYESGQIFSFEIPSQQKREGIVIKVEQKNEGKLYWKNNLKYNGRSVDFVSAKELILPADDIKELEVLLRKINDNIEWYEKTIQGFEDLKFVYEIYRTEKEFDTFQEVFEAL